MNVVAREREREREERGDASCVGGGGGGGNVRPQIPRPGREVGGTGDRRVSGGCEG